MWRDLLGEKRIIGVGEAVRQIVQRHRWHFRQPVVVRCQVVLGLPNCLRTLVRRGQVQVELAVVEHLFMGHGRIRIPGGRAEKEKYLNFH